MIHCKDCAHWTRYKDMKDDGLERTYKDTYDPHMGKCECPKFVYSESGGKFKADELAYWDSEGYGAGFGTGEDFGCVHGKEEKKKGEERR